MNDEEITINELLEHFQIKVKLPNALLNYMVSSDFLKADMQQNDEEYVFNVDNVNLTIAPNDKNETIRKLVIINGENTGGIILGYDSIQYLT